MGRFEGTFTLRDIPQHSELSGGYFGRLLKRWLGGLGNPVQMLYVPDPVNPLRYIADEGTVYMPDHSFETDGATVPRILWCVEGFAPMDWLKAAILHDWFFETHHYGRDLVTFDQANKLLAEMCLSLGVRRWKTACIYLAVSTAGACLWNYQYTDSGEPDYSRPVNDAPTKEN